MATPNDLYFLTEAYETRNLAGNPSVENALTYNNPAGDAMGWFVGTLATVARTEAAASRGNAAVHMVANTNGDYGYYRELYNTTYGAVQSLGVDLRGILSEFSGAYPTITVQFGRSDGATFVLGGSVVCPLDGVWRRYEILAINLALGAGGYTEVRFLVPNITNGFEWYVDGLQIEPGLNCSDYADGSMAGCRWLGRKHQSISYRSPEYRGAGRSRGFDDAYGFLIGSGQGLGVADVKQLSDALALLPGSEAQGLKIPERDYALIGIISGDNETGDPYKDLIYNRARLTRAARPTDPTPAKLTFTGGFVPVEIEFRYNGGLEGGLQNVGSESLTLRGLANYPYWKEKVNQEIYTLNHQALFTAAQARYTLRRVAGQWLEVEGDLTGGVRGITHDSVTGWTYYAGDFATVYGSPYTYVARHDGIDMYPVGTDGGGWTVGPDGPAYGSLVLRDGRVLFYGNFLNVRFNGGTISAKYVAVFTPSTNGWGTFGANNGTGPVYAAAEDPATADVILAGDFDNWAAVAAADNIVRIRKADGLAYAIGSGLNDTVRAMEWINPRTLVIVGGFTASGATTLNRIAEWTPGAAVFSQVAMGTNVGANAEIWALAPMNDGTMALGGAFTSLCGIAALRAGIYNGSAVEPLGDGIPAGIVKALVQMPSGELIIAGEGFQAAGSLNADAVNAAVVWTGGGYAPTDFQYGGSPVYTALETNPAGDLWVGNTTNESAIAAGYTEIDYSGSAEAFPIIVMRGPAGYVPQMIRNYSLPHIPAVWFQAIQTTGASEVLTVYTGLPPDGHSQVESNYQPAGLQSSLVPGSLVGLFYLRPGLNRIGARSSSTAAAEVMLSLRVQPAHISKDTVSV